MKYVIHVQLANGKEFVPFPDWHYDHDSGWSVVSMMQYQSGEVAWLVKVS